MYCDSFVTGCILFSISTAFIDLSKKEKKIIRVSSVNKMMNWHSLSSNSKSVVIDILCLTRSCMGTITLEKEQREENNKTPLTISEV